MPALTLKDVLPLFEALEAVEYIALRYTLRSPHDLNVHSALKRISRAEQELHKLKTALENERQW